MPSSPFFSAPELIRELHAAVNRHDAAGVAALCHERIIWVDPAAPTTLHGRDAVRRFHEETMLRALPDARVDVLAGPYSSSDGTECAVRLRIRGTMTGPLIPPGFRPTNGALEFETAEFSRVENGLLIHHRVVLDMLALARQIGAVPPAGSTADRFGLWFQHFAAWRLRHENE